MSHGLDPNLGLTGRGFSWIFLLHLYIPIVRLLYRIISTSLVPCHRTHGGLEHPAGRIPELRRSRNRTSKGRVGGTAVRDRGSRRSNYDYGSDPLSRFSTYWTTVSADSRSVSTIHPTSGTTRRVKGEITPRGRALLLCTLVSLMSSFPPSGWVPTGTETLSSRKTDKKERQSGTEGHQ